MTDATSNAANDTAADSDSIRDRAAHAYEAARSKAGEAVDASLERAQGAARRATDAIDTNPVGVIVGGLALGALVAAVIPRGRRERELLAPVGRRVGATAGGAIAPPPRRGDGGGGDRRSEGRGPRRTRKPRADAFGGEGPGQVAVRRHHQGCDQRRQRRGGRGQGSCADALTALQSVARSR